MTVPILVEYERKHRQDVLSLLFYSRRTHTHLDWYKTGRWLDMEDNVIQLAYDGKNNLIGVMGLSAPLNNASWVRLIALAQGTDAGTLTSLMWQAVVKRLAQTAIESVTLLLINTWLGDHLQAMGFYYVEDVITMHRTGIVLPEPPENEINIRNGYTEDIPDILHVDHAAFKPPWQMTRSDVFHSQRQAASCTLAEYRGDVVGYELSTRHHTSGHLARLAVVPEMQGKRIGAVLLHHLLNKFQRRGVRHMTVNTQQSNIRSQRLYSRYYFRRNGFDLAIWQYDVKADSQS